MTLVISSINEESAIQISDRRRSAMQGADFSDDLNKSFILVCEDARMIVGFAGLAQIGEFKTGQWILEALGAALEKYDCYFGPALDEFSKMATRQIREIVTNLTEKQVRESDMRLSIVFSGYRYHTTPPLGQVFLVSNFDTVDEDEPSLLPEAFFRISGKNEKRPGTGKFGLTILTGVTNVLSNEHLKQMALGGSSRNRKRIGIRLITKASKKERTVSSDCSSIILPRNPSQGSKVDYHHLNDEGATSHLPGKLVATKEQGIRATTAVEIRGGSGVLRY